MRKWPLLILFLPATLFAQGTGRIDRGALAAQPNTCPTGNIYPSLGDFYVATDQSPVQVYVCSEGGWIQVGRSSGGVTQNPVTSSGLANPFPWQINRATIFKGPIPTVDLSAFGMVSDSANTAPVLAGDTSDCVSGSHAVTVNHPGHYPTGTGIDLVACGAANGMSMPAAPRLAVVNNAAEMGSLWVVPGPTGVSYSTQYCYRASLRDKGQGLTVASTEVCIDGPASLGPQNVTISSSSLSNNTITYITPARSPEVLSVGTKVRIYGTNNDGLYGGWPVVASVPNNTTFTVKTSNDSRNIMGPIPSGTGGTGTYDVGIQAIFTSPTSPGLQYLIFEGATGAETKYGWSMDTYYPSDDPNYFTWDDWGARMMGGVTWPAWVPNTPPSTSVPDTLVTTVTAGGTSPLTVATAPGTSNSSAITVIDACPNILAGFAAAQYAGEPKFPANGGNVYVSNSFCDLSAYPNTGVDQAGQIYLGDTMVLPNNVNWHGNITPYYTQCSSFSIGCYTAFNTGSANPGVIFSNGNIDQITFIGSGNAYNSMLTTGQAIPSFLMSRVNFEGPPIAGDYMGIPLIMWAAYGGGTAGIHMFETACVIQGRTSPGSGGSAPCMLIKNYGEVNFDTLFLSHGGLLYQPPAQGGGFNVTMRYEDEGNITPMFATYGNVSGIDLGATISGAIPDTSRECVFAAFGATVPTLQISSSLPGSDGPAICGVVSSIAWSGTNSSGILGVGGSSDNTTWRIQGWLWDNYYNMLSGAAATQDLLVDNVHRMVGSGYKVFTNPGPPPSTAPTVTICAAGSGSCPSSPLGALTTNFAYCAVWADNSLGVCSPFTTAGYTVNGTTQNYEIVMPSAPSSVGAVCWAIASSTYHSVWNLSGNPCATTTTTFYSNGAGGVVNTGNVGSALFSISGGGPVQYQGQKFAAAIAQTGSLQVRDSGTCTMTAGSCAAQPLTRTYTNAPLCFVQYVSGTLAGIARCSTSTTTATPNSTVNTDTAVLNWVVLGN